MSAISDSTSSASSAPEEPLYRIPSAKAVQKPTKQEAVLRPTSAKQEAVLRTTSAKQEAETSPPEPPEKQYPKPTEQEIEAFRGQLDEWVRVEEQMRRLAVARRECVLRMKALGGGVEAFMSRFGYEHINRRDGSKIQFKTREVKKPITLKEIKQQLMTLEFPQPISAESLLLMLFNKENREKIVRTSLRRLIPPVPSQLEV